MAETVARKIRNGLKRFFIDLSKALFKLSLIFGFSLLCVKCINYCKERPSAEHRVPSVESLKMYAVVYCQGKVKDALKSPNSADFPWGVTATASQDQRRFTVVSYVDAKNSLGAVVRTHYVCVARTANGYEKYNDWSLEELTGIQ